MANVEKIDGEDAFIFIENNCPVCEAAKACSGICAKELEVFKSVLGPNIQTERSEHILKDAHRCTYKVTAL
jgi:predicted ArsR family transcriptional regulator